MADSSESISVMENVTEDVANATKPVSTPEGMGIAYGSIVIMALVPIFCGAFRSIKFQKEQKESGEKPETMSGKDAAMFPVYASCALFGLYVFFQIFSKEYINLLLTGYFFFLGVIALSYVASPAITKLIPASFPNQEYHFMLTEGKGASKSDIFNYEFDRRELVTLGLCALVGVWYLLKRHWIANNMFGLSFAVYGVECLQLNRVSTGCILLGGLFIYDIFWVFATDVMVTVAKSFEAPIKLVFPQDLLVKGLAADNFAMLGLGDIVIPGIFIALLLRFDISRKNGSKIYFYTTFTAYVIGLVMTIVVMHYFKHPQPALLYLVPACVCTPLLLAAIKGDLHALFSYEDSPEKPAEEKKSEEKDAVSKKDK